MRINFATGPLLGLSTLVVAWDSVLAQEPKPLEPRKAAVLRRDDGDLAPEKAVSRLVEQLRQHPVKPSMAAKRVGLYMIDVERGAVTLIAEEPEPGLVYCGSPEWYDTQIQDLTSSPDGRYVVFGSNRRGR